MTTDEKCAAILRNIVKRCNDDDDSDHGEPTVGFGPDWGGYSLTIHLGSNHTHVGSADRDYTFEQMIDRLHDQLLEGHGLSLQIPIGSDDP